MLLHKRVGEMSEKKKVKNAEYDVVVIGGGMSRDLLQHWQPQDTGPEQHWCMTDMFWEAMLPARSGCTSAELLRISAKPDLEESGILHEIMLDKQEQK